MSQYRADPPGTEDLLRNSGLTPVTRAAVVPGATSLAHHDHDREFAQEFEVTGGVAVQLEV